MTDGGHQVDFAALLRDAWRDGICGDCGRDLDFRARPKSAFCSALCSRRWRDRERYARNGEAERERSRDYYRRHREQVLARSRAKREAAPRPAPVQRFCSEDGKPLEGQQRVVCSSRCRDKRYARLHPEAYAAKEARKVERRRERRRAGESS